MVSCEPFSGICIGSGHLQDMLRKGRRRSCRGRDSRLLNISQGKLSKVFLQTGATIMHRAETRDICILHREATLSARRVYISDSFCHAYSR
jgi:hypothetical protein